VLPAGQLNLSAKFTPTDAATYASTTATATINIVPATLTITPDNVSRTYGDTNPTFTFHYSGFVNNEDPTVVVATQPTCSTTATGASSIGQYPITCSGGVVPNYTLTYQNGTLTIDPASLTITADDRIKTFGQTVTFAGTEFTTNNLVNSDSVSRVTLASAGSPADAGVAGSPYSITASNAVGTGLGNYTINYADGSLIVNKADAIVSVTPYSVTYDGDPHTATGSVKGVLGEVLTGLDLSGTAHTHAGNYNGDAWTFADSTGNYNNAAGNVNDTIAKADPLVSATAGTFTYDGNPHAGSGAATGAKGENLTPVNIAYKDAGGNLLISPPVNAGTYSVAARFAGDNNYNPKQSAAAQLIINKAEAVITVTPYSVTYDGNPHTATGTAVGVETPPADLSSMLHLSGTTHTSAGDYATDPWTFDGDNNYKLTNGNMHDHINQADANTTVNGYTGVYDGNPHGATGSAIGVKGEDLTNLLSLGATFTHVPGGTANWIFAGDTNYKPSSGTASISISQAPSTTMVTVPGGASFTFDGLPHQATVLVTGVAGLNSTPAPLYSCGHVPINVADSGCTASYSYPGDNDHGASSDSKTYAIAPAASVTTITPASVSVTYDGQPHGATATVTGVGGLNQAVPVTYTPGGNTVPVNAATYITKASYAGDPNHRNSDAAPGSIVIGAATPMFSSLSSPTIVLATASTTLSGTIKAGALVPPGNVSITVNGITQSAAINSATGGFSSTFNTSAFGVSAAGYTINYSYTDTVDNNFKPANAAGNLGVKYIASGMCASDVGHAIRQPINPDGSSVFKQKSTVPAKFAVCDANGNSIGTPGVVFAFRLVQTASGTMVSTVDEAVDSTTPDTAFRWDPTGQQWIFNMNTKSLSANMTYVYLITLNDGSSIQFQFGLR